MPKRTAQPLAPEALAEGRFVVTAQARADHAASTFCGVDRTDGQPVWIRRVSLAASTSDTQRRLEHEAGRLAGLDVPEVAPLLWVEAEGDSLTTVSRWVSGETLRARLDDQGPLSHADALALGRALLRGLIAVHARGVVHAGLDPEHVILPDGEIGHAVIVGLDAHDRSVEIQRARLSRLRYAAPERSGLLPTPPDARTDLYSVGIILYEAVSGVPPFSAERLDALLREHLVLPLPALELVVPGTPRALADVLRHLAAKDPDDRYQSAEGALADLEALGRGPPDADTGFVVGLGDRRRSLTRAAFVGRIDELTALDAKLDEASRGRGALVAIEGPAGRGKSALLEELTRRARARGSRVLRGTGVSAQAVRPFDNLSGVVDDVVALGAGKPELLHALEEKAGEALAVLAPSFPALASLAPEGATQGPEATGAQRGVRALAQLIGASGAPGTPALVVLDDFQWADEASHQLVGELARTRARGEPLHALVVIAVRTAETEGDRALAALREMGVEVHALSPLDEAQVRILAMSMAGRLPEPALEAVVRASGGSPFLAAAALRGLLESHALVERGRGWEVEPSAAQQASREAGHILMQRLSLLSEPTRDVLSAGAVLGRTFGASDASALIGGRADVDEAIEDARRRELLWVDERAHFVHDRIRETLLARLGERERRALHLRAALHVELEKEAGREFELAYHFDAAGEPARALPFALEAARAARSRYALEVAERYYRIAERGAVHAGAETRREAAQGLGEVLMLRGAYVEARQTLERARALAANDLERAAIDGKLGEVASKVGDARAAGEAVERALELLGYRIPKRRVWCVIALIWQLLIQVLHTVFPRAIAARHEEDPSSASRLGAQLHGRLAYAYFWQRGITRGALWAHLRFMNLAEHHPGTPELAHAYSSHAVAMSALGWFSRGITYVERSLAMRRAAGDGWGEGESHHLYSVVLYAAGRCEEARAHALEGAALLDRMGDVWERDSARWHAAISSLHLGRLREAVDETEALLGDARAVGDLTRIGDCLATLAVATRGRAPEELVHAQLADVRTNAATRRHLLQAEALRLEREGKLEEAIAKLEEAVRVIDRASLHIVYSVPASTFLAAALRARAERVPSTAPRRRRALALSARRAARRACRGGRLYPTALPSALRERALASAMLGRRGRARRDLSRALAVAERQGALWDAALTRRELARLDAAHSIAGADERVAAAERAVRSIEDQVAVAEPSPTTLSLAARFETVLDAGRRIASSLTEEAVLEAVNDAALMLFRAERGIVVLLADGERAAEARGGAVSHEVVRRVVEARAPLIFDTDEARRLCHASSLLGVPIRARGRIAACFYVTHASLSRLFGHEEARLGLYVAALAGAALENARGFAELEAVADERERMRRAAEAAVEARTEFLSIAAHELRTPLTPLRLHAQSLLLRRELPRPMLDRLATIDRQVTRIAELVDRLLDVSTIMASGVSLEREWVDLAALVRGVLERHADDLARAGCEVELITRGPLSGIWDRARLAQVVSHLLSNAQKFGPGQPIEITLEGTAAEVRLSVRDHGIGIPEEHQARLFQPFERAVTARQYGGFGLGLWIVHRIIEAHGGAITIESQPAEGARFTISLSRAP